MAKISEKKIRNALSKIIHPAIKCDIIKLGLVRDISIKNDTAHILMAFPFVGFPVSDLPYRIQIRNDIKKLIEDMGLRTAFDYDEMNISELEHLFRERKKSMSG